jgi:hypothetical protein
VLHDSIVGSFPDYAMTMKNAPALPPSYGRVIILYPRLPMAGFNPIPLGGPGGFGIVTVLVDKTEKTTVGDQTFVFVDLPAGSHTVSHTRGGLLSGTYDTSIDLKAGETKFIQIISEHSRRARRRWLHRATRSKCWQICTIISISHFHLTGNLANRCAPCKDSPAKSAVEMYPYGKQRGIGG